MDPFTAALSGIIALAGIGTGAHWRSRARTAEAEAARLRRELATERHAATHDALTGLPNRRAFHQAGAARAADPGRYPMFVVAVDLDDFKSINDAYGHAAGDEVLVTTADRLARHLDGHLVARFGGDEFFSLVTAPAGDDHWQRLAVRRLSETLGAPMQVLGRGLSVTASVGLAAVRAADGAAADLADAVRRADLAMYATKRRRLPAGAVTGGHQGRPRRTPLTSCPPGIPAASHSFLSMS